MAPILRSVNFAQITRGGRSVARNFSSYRRSYESKRTRIGIADVLTRGAGATLGCYFGYKLTGHWIPELEEKRQKAMRNAMGHSEKIEDLREKMWSDTKLVKVFSDLEKKLLSELSGVNLESMWSDLREKFGFDQRS
ncbi:unnamed protein product [Brassica oleracea var. botrytis]|uniref:Uncharacterized protein n=3 Tax=Brassica TaxID=3705 RepID=A0ABQ7Z805_BRANA|nr:PREDICTED: uncharacterized protein LOC106298920 [Brassica oleracea var. oleracea]XP_013726981.1 uncharacterized protein LOC106430734 [Brassica napus]KAH0876303.1 hypothetical protein HID58_073665 [Brassica napus]VDD64947.1 unnamed protein product [Brassica oleracea]